MSGKVSSDKGMRGMGWEGDGLDWGVRIVGGV